jgi:hypothetical protein
MPINLDGNPINISLAFGLIQITNMVHLILILIACF